jgi:hypothetical protein
MGPPVRSSAPDSDCASPRWTWCRCPVGSRLQERQFQGRRMRHAEPATERRYAEPTVIGVPLAHRHRVGEPAPRGLYRGSQGTLRGGDGAPHPRRAGGAGTGTGRPDPRGAGAGRPRHRGAARRIGPGQRVLGSVRRDAPLGSTAPGTRAITDDCKGQLSLTATTGSVRAAPRARRPARRCAKGYCSPRAFKNRPGARRAEYGFGRCWRVSSTTNVLGGGGGPRRPGVRRATA